jgi:hypothetical protein
MAISWVRKLKRPILRGYLEVYLLPCGLKCLNIKRFGKVHVPVTTISVPLNAAIRGLSTNERSY